MAASVRICSGEWPEALPERERSAKVLERLRGPTLAHAHQAEGLFQPRAPFAFECRRQRPCVAQHGGGGIQAVRITQ